MTSIAREVVETLALLTPYEVPGFTRRRFGSRVGDGGYVLLQELLAGQPVISAGIGNQISFDLELAERGHVIHMFDHTIQAPPSIHPRFRFQRRGLAAEEKPDTRMTTLARIVEQIDHAADDIILKMDIEGAEWATLAAVPEALLDRFAMISLELHNLQEIETAWGCARIRPVLERLARRFVLFHVHANNAALPKPVLGHPVFPLLEVSYARRGLVRPAPNATVYPSTLDPPNLRGRPELPMWCYPFLPVAPRDPAEFAEAIAACADRLDRVTQCLAADAHVAQLRARILTLEQELAATRAMPEPAPRIMEGQA